MGRAELQRPLPPAAAEPLVANEGWIADDRGEPAIRSGGPCEEVGGDGLGLRTPGGFGGSRWIDVNANGIFQTREETPVTARRIEYGAVAVRSCSVAQETSVRTTSGGV